MPITEQVEASRGEPEKILNEPSKLQINHWKNCQNTQFSIKNDKIIRKIDKECAGTLFPLKPEKILPWLRTFVIATFDSLKVFPNSIDFLQTFNKKFHLYNSFFLI